MVQGHYKWSIWCPLLRQRSGWQSTQQHLLSILPITDSKPLQNSTPSQRIYLRLIALLQKLPLNQQFKEKHTRSKLGHGNIGESTISSSEPRTSLSNPSPGINKSSSLELFPWLCMKDGFQDQLMIIWLRAQPQVPFNMYVQPSEKMAPQLLPLTKMQDLASFYSNSIGLSAKQTQQKSIRMWSQCVTLPRLEKGSLRALDCHFPTCLHYNLLCMLILQISQSPRSKAETNNNPLPKFFRDSKLIDHNNPELEYSDAVLLTLEQAEERWKNGHHHSKMALWDVKLSPVIAAAAIVKQIWSYLGSLDDSPVFSTWSTAAWLMSHCRTSLMPSGMLW